ncbi:hypothetical protein JXO59_15425 [candidate division KSB1 bacterium]|nr:hypothetical protein [candidate division KSB1 bacterium]
MKKFAIILLLSAFVIWFNCDEKNPSKPKSKDDTFVYGFIGIEPDPADPDTSRYWVFVRLFNYANAFNIEGELSRDEIILPLRAGYRFSDKVFTEIGSEWPFAEGQTWKLRLWDDDRQYSGNIRVLPRLTLTYNLMVNALLQLTWSDIGADFYDVTLLGVAPGNIEHHLQTENTSMQVDLSDYDFGTANDILIVVGGFKGFSPLSDPEGNMSGCAGFTFGYSCCEIILNRSTGSFRTAPVQSDAHRRDDHILALLNAKQSITAPAQPQDLSHIFTYAFLAMSPYQPERFNALLGTTLSYPAGAITLFEPVFEGELLEYFCWGGFYYTFNKQKLANEYDANKRYQFELNINSIKDSATVALPDTFSISGAREIKSLPTPPFTVHWRQVERADFYFVDIFWQLSGDQSLAELFLRDENQLTIEQMPEGTAGAQIQVVAVNGSNPYHALQPNIAQHNGYFFCTRESIDILRLNNTANKESLINEDRLAEWACLRQKRIAAYLLEKSAETQPQLFRFRHMIERANHDTAL